MKALSLFTGIMGIDLACEWAGIETVAMCERDPFCQKVIRKHKPNIPLYDDVCTLTKERLEADGIGTIDLIHGGYPCQPFSVAGKREGAEDDRHLWPEVFRLIQALNPRWFVGENVAGHVTLGLDTVLSDLDSIGYSAEALVIPACAVDARHRRDRVFIVAHSKSEQNRWVQLGRVVTDLTPRSRTENVADTKKQGLEKPQRWGRGAKGFAGFERGGLPDREQTGNWAIEPNVGRMADGVSNRVDRLKALGNAVVPQQIYPILAAIKQIDDMMRAV